MSRYGVVVIGASWGGLHAVGVVLSALPRQFPVPVVVVLHRGRTSTGEALIGALQHQCRLPVEEAADKAPLTAGTVAIAPADYHLLIEGSGFALSTDEPVQYSRPSIDVLFESAADTFEQGTVGVVLTGANADGAAGLAAIHNAGGLGIVQDPDDSERPEMPRAAIRAGGADRIMPLAEIGSLLVELCGAA